MLKQNPTGTVEKEWSAGFPIHRTQSGFNRRKPDLEQWIGPRALAMIEQMQPFKLPDLKESSLLFLHDCDISDKHRLLLPSIAHLSGADIRTVPTSRAVGTMIGNHWQMHFGRFEDKAVLATVRFTPPDAIASVELRPAIRVVLGASPAIKPATQILDGLIQVVEAIGADLAPLLERSRS